MPSFPWMLITHHVILWCPRMRGLGPLRGGGGGYLWNAWQNVCVCFCVCVCVRLDIVRPHQQVLRLAVLVGHHWWT